MMIDGKLYRHINRPWLKDVRAHCYCTPLVRTLFIRHARGTSFSSARTKSKTQQHIELMTFVLTWYANIFVGCSVTPLFFGRSLPFLILSIILKNEKNLYVGSLIFSCILFNQGRIGTWIQVCVTQEQHFLRLIPPDLMTYVAKIYQIGLYMLC